MHDGRHVCSSWWAAEPVWVGMRVRMCCFLCFSSRYQNGNYEKNRRSKICICNAIRFINFLIHFDFFKRYIRIRCLIVVREMYGLRCRLVMVAAYIVALGGNKESTNLKLVYKPISNICRGEKLLARNLRSRNFPGRMALPRGTMRFRPCGAGCSSEGQRVAWIMQAAVLHSRAASIDNARTGPRARLLRAGEPSTRFRSIAISSPPRQASLHL